MNRLEQPLPDDGDKLVEAAQASLLGHDLRAALADIIGGLRLIDQSGFDEETKVQMERIRAAGETMARLLEETIALIQGEDAETAPHPVNVQMSRFLYDVEMRWSGRAHEKGLGFRLVVAPEVPAVVTLDRIALERVLANLLSNAVKYTDAGAVDIGVERSDDGALRFVVSDRGPGFSQAALARLFEYRGRPDGTGKPGDGLGMHISKELTDRLGGRIFVDNRAGGGAEVTLEIPAGAWAPAKAEAEIELPDLSHVKILVADDTPTNQALIGQMLARMGAEFEVAEDGVEALHWLEREDFDIALIDIEMPRLSGLDVIRTVRANDRLHARMPIVAVTAYVLRANREAIYAAGADAILAKPLAGIEIFGMSIAATLGRRAATRPDSEAPAEHAAQEPPAGELVDRDRFDHLLEIAGPASSRELLDRLSSDLGHAQAGLTAALAAGDRAAIRAETHVLIALAGAVGAGRLQAMAERLNLCAHRRDEPGWTMLGAKTADQAMQLIAFVETERARLDRAGAGEP